MEDSLLVVTGIFENGRFIPDTPISLPQSKKATLTIEENRSAEAGPANKWREIGEAILACDEELPGEPLPIRLRTVAETEAL